MSIEQMPKISKKAEMISNAQARRVLLNLQGLGAVPECSSARMVQKVVQRLGYVQIDSINVLERAHHLILGARLAQYRHEHFTHALEKSRGLFEHWTHDASAIPTQWFAHWKHRFARYNQRVERSAWWREQFRGDAAPIIRRTLARVRRDGPLRTRDFEATNEVMDKDGWFHTGDIGVFIDEKFLKITDRKKEIFKTSGGKYIAPQAMENKFKESRFIEQLIVVGEGEKFPGAFIVPSFLFLKEWALQNNLNFDKLSNEELVLNEKVLSKFKEEIEEINEFFGSWDHLKEQIIMAQQQLQQQFKTQN